MLRAFFEPKGEVTPPDTQPAFLPVIPRGMSGWRLGVDRRYLSDTGEVPVQDGQHLQQQSQELRGRLEIVWTYVGPGCSHADDPRTWSVSWSCCGSMRPSRTGWEPVRARRRTIPAQGSNCGWRPGLCEGIMAVQLSDSSTLYWALARWAMFTRTLRGQNDSFIKGTQGSYGNRSRGVSS